MNRTDGPRVDMDWLDWLSFAIWFVGLPGLIGYIAHKKGRSWIKVVLLTVLVPPLGIVEAFRKSPRPSAGQPKAETLFGLFPLPSWLIVSVAVVLAFPFGWGLGLLVAYVVAGRDFGQLPAATVSLSVLAALAFALSPSFTPSMRLKVMLLGSVAFILLAWLSI